MSDFIDGAKEQCAIANRYTNGVTVTREQVTREQVIPYIKGTWDFVCFTAGKDTYSIGKIGESPSCSVHGAKDDPHFYDRARRAR